MVQDAGMKRFREDARYFPLLSARAVSRACITRSEHSRDTHAISVATHFSSAEQREEYRVEERRPAFDKNITDDVDRKRHCVTPREFSHGARRY